MQGANPCPHTYAAIGCMSRMAAPQEETHERGMFPPPLHQNLKGASYMNERLEEIPILGLPVPLSNPAIR